MAGHRITLKGFKVKDGKVIRDEKSYSVSQQLQRRYGNKKVRVVRRGTQ